MKDGKKIHIDGKDVHVHLPDSPSQSADDPRPRNKEVKIEEGKKGGSSAIIILLIIIAVILLIAIGFILYFVLRGNQPATTSVISTSSTPSETPTASPKERVGWQTYTNTRYDFSIQVPKDLVGEDSVNGDGITYTTSNPPMTIKASATLNTNNQTLQQIIDSGKGDLNANEIQNFTVLSEKPIQMGGQEGIKSVWDYVAAVTGDAIVTANAITIKNNTIYKIEFLIQSDLWPQYETMFDEVVDSFKFI